MSRLSTLFLPDGSMTAPTGTFEAHVESNTDDFLEDDGTFDGAEAAIQWGRERAPIVMIRLGGSHDTFFSAGEVHAEDEDGNEFPVVASAGAATRVVAPSPDGWTEGK